jgi:hypothetical protein
MRTVIVKNGMVFGLTLFVIGLVIIVFAPSNLFIFTQRITSPTGPIGTVISLIGLVFVVAGGRYGKPDGASPIPGNSG